MLQYLLNCDPLWDLFCKHSPHKVAALLRDVTPMSWVKFRNSLPHQAEGLPARLPSERWIATKQNEEYHASRPNIALGSVFLAQNLWSHVLRSSKQRCHHLAWIKASCKAKVNDLEGVLQHRRLFQQQEVLWLQVAVADVVGVHVIDSSHQLLHDKGSLNLRKSPLNLNLVKELPTSAQLHHQVHIAAIFEGIIELEDMRMIQLPQHGDLSFQHNEIR
mmetsp:Transcript_34823/g.81314  ORF Transcript_34823/g.81314 Transcript_34823/m.81314 type:complete len:218 (+) Transcript_34823:685-1338(+)